MKQSLIKTITSFTYNVRYYTKGLYARLNEENVLFLSSGIAFNGILCLIPLLLLLTAIVGMFLHSTILPVQKVDDILNTIFPAQPYAQQIKVAVKNIIRDVERYRSTFGLYGVAILIWASASMFSSVRVVLNKIYKVTPTKLVVIAIVENIVVVIILGVLFIVANFFSWILVLINSLLKDIPELGPINLTAFTKSISIVASYLSAFVMFYVLNRYLPDRRVAGKVAFVAAITTTSLWWIAGKIFGWYLTAFQPYSKLYGTYSFLLVSFIWIYYLSVVFVIGVIMGQLYREKQLTGYSS